MKPGSWVNEIQKGLGAHEGVEKLPFSTFRRCESPTGTFFLVCVSTYPQTKHLILWALGFVCFVSLHNADGDVIIGATPLTVIILPRLLLGLS